MSDLILGILPILIMWALPLAPMAYAAIAAIAEGVAKRRQAEGDPRSAETRKAQLGAREPATPSSGEQQAA